MKLGIYTPTLEKHFKDQNHCVVGNKFWKKFGYTDDLGSVYILEKNRVKLTQKYYSFIEKIYMQENRPMILESEYLEGFCTLYEALKERKDLNKKKILLEWWSAVYELETIGLYYWDLKTENIMINDLNHMKLVDLSGAISNPKEQNFLFKIGDLWIVL